MRDETDWSQYRGLFMIYIYRVYGYVPPIYFYGVKTYWTFRLGSELKRFSPFFSPIFYGSKLIGNSDWGQSWGSGELVSRGKKYFKNTKMLLVFL